MAAPGYEKEYNPHVTGADSPLTNVASTGRGDVFPDDERPPLMTRLGLSADSFKKRTLADEHNQLNKTLKGRHLNMIAIGGSIGAGLFGKAGLPMVYLPAMLKVGVQLAAVARFAMAARHLSSFALPS